MWAARFVPNFPGSRGIDFLGKESSDTQPNCIDSFTMATDPFAPTLFRLLVELSFCLNMSEMAFVVIFTAFSVL